MVEAERASIDVLVLQIDARLDAGEKIVADAGIERGAMELVRQRDRRSPSLRSLMKSPPAH